MSLPTALEQEYALSNESHSSIVESAMQSLAITNSTSFSPAAITPPDEKPEIYDLVTVRNLPKDSHETFFDRYAKGNWDMSFSTDAPLPQEIRQFMPSSCLGTPVGSLDRASSLLHNENDNWVYHLDYTGEAVNTSMTASKHLSSSCDGGEEASHLNPYAFHSYPRDAFKIYREPPDLRQSVENIYQNFISDKNGILPSPRSGPASSFCKLRFPSPVAENGGCKKATHKVDPAPCLNPGGYAALAAKRYKELGYLEAPMPTNEEERRKALRFFKPFHSRLDPNLDRIARLGKTIFGTGRALISLVDGNEVQFNFDSEDPYMVERGTPICSHTILRMDGDPMVVLDTSQDWRFKGNSVVTDDLSVRFYAGQPLQASTGENIGVFCVVDDKPRRNFTDDDKTELRELSLIVSRELENMARKRQTLLWNQMQFAIEAFNQEAVVGDYSIDHLLTRAVDHIAAALDVEGVLIFDAVNTKRRRSQTDPSTWPTRTGELVPIMTASEHATNLAEIINNARRDRIIGSFFEQYPNGAVYSPGDALPENLGKLLPNNVVAAAAVPISRSEQEHFAFICVYTLKSGYYFTLPDPTISFIRAMGLILCNVQQKAVLNLADKAKVDFIANISHELRTPLHGVIASCDLLSETDLSETQKGFLGTARLCASNLTDTINHVLDFTKSTSGTAVSHLHGDDRKNAKRVPTDLAQLIEDTMVETWMGRSRSLGREKEEIAAIYASSEAEHVQYGDGLLETKRIEPLIEIDPEVENWTVMVDKVGLRRALMNLIGNSVKFTREGYVKVKLSRGAPTPNSSSIPIQITVEDTGIGMSQQFLREKLFHPFSQEEPLAQGVGLGLAIAWAILKSPGVDGCIDVKSQAGKGTKMIVYFSAPLVQENQESTARYISRNFSLKSASVAFLGFEGSSSGSFHSLRLLRMYYSSWFGKIQDCPREMASVLVVDADNLTQDEFMTASTVSKKNQQSMLVLASSPINNVLLQAVRESCSKDGICLVSSKPCGPREFARLLSKISQHLVKPWPRVLSDSCCHAPRASSSSIAHSSSLPGSNTKNVPSYPLQPPASSDTLGSNPSSGNTSLKRTLTSRALVVEDNPVNRRVLSIYLRKRGHEFIEAENGEEGIKVFQKYPAGYFDICLMDLQMPVKDGFEATAAIRAIERNRISSGLSSSSSKVKVCALSGLASPEDRERAQTVGFDDYLVKPVSFKTLDEIFRSLLL